MNGHLNPAQLALLAGGDLAGAERSGCLRHLQSCAACREEARSFERTGEWLREFAVEPCEEDLQVVRDSVAANLHAPQTAWVRDWRWAWFAFASASLVLLVFFIARRPPERMELAKPLMSSLPAMELPRVSLVLPAPVRHRRRQDAGIRSANLIAQNDGTSVLKLTTADPNVVILLPMGEKNEN